MLAAAALAYYDIHAFDFYAKVMPPLPPPQVTLEKKKKRKCAPWFVLAARPTLVCARGGTGKS